MKQLPLNGYLLHQRAYQEKRAIYQLFSYEQGVVHGIAPRGVPLFTPICLLATGTRSLKSFSQLALRFSSAFELDEMTNHTGLMPPKGRVQYALLYINEVLCKLLVAENPHPRLWQAYHISVQKLYALSAMRLRPDDEMQAMQIYLRAFERVLFAELGVMVDFHQDGLLAEPIDERRQYRFVPQLGFVLDEPWALDRIGDQAKITDICLQGEQIMQMAQALSEQASTEHLDKFSQIQRALMDFLLDYQPLNSRTLWQQSLRYAS